MAVKPEGVWLKNNYSWYSEILRHTFWEKDLNDTRIRFELSRRNLNKNDDPLLITIQNGFDSVAGDETVTIRYEGNINEAKEMIDDAIKIFEQKQNVNIYQIKDYFSFYMEQQNNLRNAAAFVNHFDNDDEKQSEKTSLEKINEHFEKNSTVDPNGTVRVKGLIELNRELNKGKLYPGDIMAFTLTHGRFPTQEEMAKMPKQGETPPPERRNFNSKEKIMSDERQDVSEQIDDYMSTLHGTQSLGNEEERDISPKEKAFRDAVINASHQRKVVADAIKNGILACLPGKDGYADTTPAVNIMTPNKPYHGEYQLFLKAIQKQDQNGFPTAEYVTYHQIDKAREEGVDIYIRQGQKGVTLLVSEKNEAGEWENKHIKLFNVAQLSNPERIKEWAGKKIEEQAQKDLEYNQTRYGTGYTPPEKKPKEPGPDIVCSSTEPEKYLGQYFAAVSMGSKFKVTPEQAAEFSEKMVSTLYAPMEPKRNKETGEVKTPPLNKETGKPITDPFSLEKTSRNANAYCKEFMRDLRMEIQKQNQPERKQEQTQSIGRGM